MCCNVGMPIADRTAGKTPSHNPETTMKTKLQQLNINDFTVSFLTFGLLVGLIIKLSF